MAAEATFTTPYQDDLPTRSNRQIGRFQKSVVVHVSHTEPEKRVESPKIPASPGDRHLTIGIIMLVISIIFFNPLALACAIPAVVFSVKSRAAEMEGRKDHMQEKDRTAFAFVIFSIIGWIVSLCVIGFVVYREFCGPTGAACETRTHI